MAKALSFEEFQASKVFKPSYDPFELGEDIPAWVYANDSCFIQVDEDGDFYLVISNMQWSASKDDLATLERILYDEFYLSEIAAQS